MSLKLKELIARVETWPEHAQDEVVASIEAIEVELLQPYELSEDDKRAIHRGIAAADEGRFATDDEVQAVFAKYRTA